MIPYAFGYMMAAKVGTGIVAELGAMRISDEIDALEVMGVPPVTFLAATRLLAAWLTLPFIYLAGIGVGYFATYIAVVEQIAETSSGGYFLIFWMFQNPPDLLFSVIKGMFDGDRDRAGRLLLRLHRLGRPGRGGHGDREVDGPEHRPRAHHRDDGDACLLGRQPTSANRGIGEVRLDDRGRAPTSSTPTSRTGMRRTRAPMSGRTLPEQAPAPGDDGHSAEEEDPTPRPSLATRPGLPDPRRRGRRPDPYRWHTGEKRDHGGEDAIEIIDLVKQFGRMRILNGLNLGLPDNQISMVLGPSGTGKSVLIKHIVGLLYPDSGDVLVHGESVPTMTDDELFEVRKKFGLLFQDGALFGSMNVYDNTAFPLRQHTDKSEDEIGEIVNRRLNEVGLAEAIDKMPNELSGGMRKRAGFARALVLDPAIVMFDEPDSGLDPVRTALLCELIREVHEENGGCYLVISHDLGTARRIADFIAVLWKGRIVESGPQQELFNSENEFVASSSTRRPRARSRWTEPDRVARAT